MKVHLLVILLGLSACSSHNVEFIPNPPLGTNQIFVNGTLKGYKNFSYTTITGEELNLFILFEENINEQSQLNLIGAHVIKPASYTEYIPVHYKTDKEGVVRVGYIQTIAGDLDGVNYRYIYSSDNFIFIKYLDTLNHTIEGNGRLVFEKLSSPFLLYNERFVIDYAFHDYYDPQ